MYELEQKTALAAEAKSVLDSWVRYEGQIKNKQQKELAESIIGKIQKELENPKTLQQILQQSIADVESGYSLFLFSHNCQLTCLCRVGGFESAIIRKTCCIIYPTVLVHRVFQSTTFTHTHALFIVIMGNKKETCSHLYWYNGKVADTIALHQAICAFTASYTLLTQSVRRVTGSIRHMASSFHRVARKYLRFLRLHFGGTCVNTSSASRTQ